jgi:hypothetical protein
MHGRTAWNGFSLDFTQNDNAHEAVLLTFVAISALQSQIHHTNRRTSLAEALAPNLWECAHAMGTPIKERTLHSNAEGV